MIVPVFAGGDFYASAYDKGPEWYAPYMDMGIVDFPTHAAWVDMNYSRHYADAGLDSWRPVYLSMQTSPSPVPKPSPSCGGCSPSKS